MAWNQLVRDSVASRNSFETVPGVQLATLPPDQPVGTPAVASWTRFHDWRTSSRLPTSIVNGPVCTAASAGAGADAATTVPIVAATTAPTTSSAALFLTDLPGLITNGSLSGRRYSRASPRSGGRGHHLVSRIGHEALAVRGAYRAVDGHRDGEQRDRPRNGLLDRDERGQREHQQQREGDESDGEVHGRPQDGQSLQQANHPRSALHVRRERPELQGHGLGQGPADEHGHEEDDADDHRPDHGLREVDERAALEDGHGRANRDADGCEDEQGWDRPAANEPAQRGCVDPHERGDVGRAQAGEDEAGVEERGRYERGLDDRRRRPAHHGDEDTHLRHRFAAFGGEVATGQGRLRRSSSSSAAWTQHKDPWL